MRLEVYHAPHTRQTTRSHEYYMYLRVTDAPTATRATLAALHNTAPNCEYVLALEGF